jgi:gliding motility-associated-like protein
MLIFTLFLQRKFTSLIRIIFFITLFSFGNGYSQNLLTNPGLDVAGVDCTMDNGAFDVTPDGWGKIYTPDRSTETQRTWYIINAPRPASPSGGCYFGFRMFGATQEGIKQNVTLVGGVQYSFSFDYLIETRPSLPPCAPQTEIKLDGTVVATVPISSVENVWERPVVTFIAPTSGSFSFEFVAKGTCQNTWNFVDDLVLEVTDPDTDGDGNPNISDPNPLVATAVDDNVAAMVGGSVSIDILANDDYLDNNDPNNLGTTSITQIGGSAGGTVALDASTGEMTYTPIAGEAGSSVTIIYQVCNDESGVLVCDDAIVTIVVADHIIANNDTVTINNDTGGNSINIVNDNDILNGNGVALGVDVTVTTVADPNPGDGVSFDSSTGEVTVVPNTPPGDYIITYTLCSIATPLVCDDAIITITVVPAPNGTITGHLYNDLNDNSTQDIGEPDLEGIDVNIIDVNGVEQTVTTDVNGDFTANVPVGATVVDIDNTKLPLGSLQTEGTDPTTVTVIGTGITVEENNGFVIITDVDNEIVVYTGISPNGDGINDQFRIVGLDNFPNNTLQIFNRWGVKIFEEDGYEQSGAKFFEGISEGRATMGKNKELPVGTYFYVLEYENASGINTSKAGYLYINR